MATAIRGRLIQMSTKLALQGITVEAVDIATGSPAATSATTDTYGFYSLTGLTSAVYFAKPLVSGDDWSIQPDTNVIFGGDLYVPDNTTTPRVQITTNTHGGFAILGSGDTYDDSTGTGTYQVLFDYASATPGLYFADGAAYIGSAGITVSGTGSLNISQAISNPLTGERPGVAVAQTPTGTSTGLPQLYGFQVAQSNQATGVNQMFGIYLNSDNAVSGTTAQHAGIAMQVSNSGSISGNEVGIEILGLNGGTVSGQRRALSVFGPPAGAANYAFYVSTTAQSVHAGNFRIGSTTAPTVALNVTGDVTVDPSTAGDAIIAHNNGSANAAAGVSYSAAVPATSTTGDLRFVVTLIGTKAWSWGLDNSDSDAWVLSENASLGTSNRIRALGNLVELLTTAKATANGWYIKGGTAAYGADTAGVLLDLVFDTAGTDLAVNMIHSATSGAGHAVLNLSTHPSGTGDPQVHFRISGTTSWRVGIDNSDSDAFVIANSAALGTTNQFRMVAGQLTVADPFDIVLGTTTGTKIGTATTQKLGFWNTAPVARAAAYTQTYATATRTHSNITAVAPSAYAAGANGYSTGAKAQEVRNAAANLVTDIANVKQVLNQVIDDLQLYGLLA